MTITRSRIIQLQDCMEEFAHSTGTIFEKYKLDTAEGGLLLARFLWTTAMLHTGDDEAKAEALINATMKTDLVRSKSLP